MSDLPAEISLKQDEKETQQEKEAPKPAVQTETVPFLEPTEKEVLTTEPEETKRRTLDEPTDSIHEDETHVETETQDCSSETHL